MIRVRPFDVALADPLSTAHGSIESRRGFFVGVERDDANRGVGEAAPLPGWTESYDACERALDGVTDPAAALDALADAPAARHGVEHALVDARARAAGVSLARFLDASPAASVPVNATVGGDDVGETVAAASRADANGFDCLKLKVGVGGLDADVDRVRAVRDAVGDEVTLRLDANGSWDRETAGRAVDALADFDVAYVEQPLPADDLDGHADLRGRGVEIALDESLAARSLETVLARDAADVVILKPMVLGGPVEATDAADRARSAGVDPVVTTTVDAAPARTAAVHVAATIPDVRPCGLGTGALLDADVAPDPAPVVDGAATVPEGPGTAGDAFDSLVW
ncbi:o-succinylbenzoate synthase [Salinirarus marinus]|uniref:o-succinylbenzoate synthase n=1 Tax=Salinirarus marinus TaxID=3068310 RepID=UPI003C6C66F3